MFVLNASVKVNTKYNMGYSAFTRSGTMTVVIYLFSWSMSRNARWLSNAYSFTCTERLKYILFIYIKSNKNMISM